MSPDYRTIDEALTAAYNGLTVDKLDVEWRNWLIGLKKSGKIKPLNEK